MMMARMDPELSWASFLIVRLLRCWAAAREASEPALPKLVELGTRLGLTGQSAVALGSLFQLTEGVLERPLRTNCCCERGLSGDERAILLMVSAAPCVGISDTSQVMPHGLPAALRWSIASVRQLIGGDAAPETRLPGRECPFAEERS